MEQLIYTLPISYWSTLENPYKLLKKYLPNHQQDVSKYVIRFLLFCSNRIIFKELSREDYNLLVDYLLSDYLMIDVSDFSEFLDKQLLLEILKTKKITELNKKTFWMLLNECEWELDYVLNLAKEHFIDWKRIHKYNKNLPHLLILLKDEQFYSFCHLEQNMDENGNYPIHLAVETGNVPFVSLLIKKHNDCLLYINKKGFYPIEICIKSKNYEMFKFILKHMDRNFEKNGNYIIHMVSMFGSKKMLKRMIKKNFKRIKNKQEMSCYSLAVVYDNKEIIRWFEKKERKCSCF